MDVWMDAFTLGFVLMFLTRKSHCFMWNEFIWEHYFQNRPSLFILLPSLSQWLNPKSEEGFLLAQVIFHPQSNHCGQGNAWLWLASLGHIPMEAGKGWLRSIEGWAERRGVGDTQRKIWRLTQGECKDVVLVKTTDVCCSIVCYKSTVF